MKTIKHAICRSNMWVRYHSYGNKDFNDYFIIRGRALMLVSDSYIFVKSEENALQE